MKSNAQVAEKRRSPRRAALMPGLIFYPNQNEHVACMVRDLSQDGALLELPLAKQLPLVFWLRLEGRDRAALLHGRLAIGELSGR